MAIFTIKQGHTQPLEITLKDINGAVNLTGSTIVFQMQDTDGVQKVAAGVVTIDGAAAGEVSYAWAAVDVDTPGEYEVEFHETTAGGKVRIYPSDTYLIIVILEDRKT